MFTAAQSPSAGSVRENLALIQKLFKLRQCQDSFFRNRSRPCLQYQIQRCTAPCVNLVNKEDYREQVDHAILFLEGKNSEVIHHLSEKMDAASDQKAYEQAAYYRDQVRRLRKLQTQQAITGDEGNIDIIAIAEKQEQVAIAVVFVRGGRVIGHKVFYPKTPKDTDLQTILLEFVPQYYLSPLRGDEVIDQIVLSENLPEKLWIQNALREKFGKGFTIIDRKKAQHRQWLLIAKTNAVYGLAQHLAQQNTVITKLEALQEALGFPNPIQHIECFDVSHTMGEATVASCVVYGLEGPQNKNYRRFNIKDVKAGDDYAAIRQALLRRYTRLKEGDGHLPDLLLIDGGKGQLRHFGPR